MKYVIACAAGLSVLCIVYFGIGFFFYYMAIDAHSDKWFLKPKKQKKHQKTIDGADSYSERRDDPVEERARQLDTEFFESHPADIWEIVSTDVKKLRLKGYYFPAEDPQSDKWFLWFHGYASSIDWSRRWVRILWEHGYHVLAPDMRGHGMSEGDYIGMGWHERLDALAWIDRIIEENSAAKILVSGVSMGGAAVMHLAGEPLSEQVRALIADCGYSSVADILSYQLHALFHLPDFPVLYAANTMIRLRAGYDIFSASAVEQLKKAEKPMLFIHGEQDKFVPYFMLERVFDAAACKEKEKLSVPDAGHGVSCCTHPELYWNAFLSFADKYIA